MAGSGEGVQVHPMAVVAPEAELGVDIRIGPCAIVGPHVRLGDRCVLSAHAVVHGRTELGPDCEVHPTAALGGAPQDKKFDGEPTRLVIGARNIFREGATANIGTETGGGITRIGDDCIFMSCSHAAHDCDVGDRVILANNVMLAGHVRVEEGAVLNGGLGVHHFTTIGCYTYIGGLSRITQDVPPFHIAEGHPSRLRGINVVGLRRAGIANKTIAALKDCFHRLWRSDRPVKHVLPELRKQYGDLPEVERLIAFVEASGQGRHGRQQERPGRAT